MRDLSSGPGTASNDKAFHTIWLIGVGVEMMVRVCEVGGCDVRSVMCVRCEKEG